MVQFARGSSWRGRLTGVSPHVLEGLQHPQSFIDVATNRRLLCGGCWTMPSGSMMNRPRKANTGVLVENVVELAIVFLEIGAQWVGNSTQPAWLRSVWIQARWLELTCQLKHREPRRSSCLKLAGIDH